MPSEFLARWFDTWRFREYCRYCGHETKSNVPKTGRWEHAEHVRACAGERGIP